MNFMSKNYSAGNQLKIGSAFKFQRNASSSSSNNYNYSSAASSTFCDDDNSMNYESDDCDFNHIIEHAHHYCEATRGGKKRVFNNQEERQQFRQNYESKKKTELCRNFEMYGTCKYGNTCSYAHGAHQLQKKTHLPSNFMTKLCTQFHQDGVCQYGDRCQFLHSIYDLKSELTYTQALKEGARITQKRNNQISGETYADCLWANLKTGDGCGAPKKPRLACFEAIYNKDSLQENLRQIEQEDQEEQSFSRSQTMPIPPAPIQMTNYNQYYQPPAPIMTKSFSYNSNQSSVSGDTQKINFSLHVQQPQLSSFNSFNQQKQMNWQPLPTFNSFNKPTIAPVQSETNQKFESFFKVCA